MLTVLRQTAAIPFIAICVLCAALDDLAAAVVDWLLDIDERV
jgi:hypothetical protein